MILKLAIMTFSSFPLFLFSLKKKQFFLHLDNAWVIDLEEIINVILDYAQNWIESEFLSPLYLNYKCNNRNMRTAQTM